MIATAPHSVEFDLLCTIAGPHQNLVRARGILSGALDFSVLLDLAREHAVRPRLILGLAALSWEGVPKDARSSLEAFQQEHVLRVLYLSDELGRIADAFTRHGIGFAAFKGAMLALDLYGDLSQREYGDIDLIVRREQVDAAAAALEPLGYKVGQGDSVFRRAFLAYQRQYTFIRADIDSAIDLHWGFSAIQLPFPLCPSEVWATLGSTVLGGRAIPVLSNDDLALLLAGHGTKEGWRSLGWVCDFAMLLDRAPDLDWAALHERAHRQGCGDALLLACAMAAALFGSTVPTALAAPLSRSIRVRRLAASLTDRLRQGLPATTGQQDLMDLDLCDRRTDRIKAVIGFALTPTPSDYRALPLPRPLWPAYYVIRPFRLTAKVAGAIAARLFRGDRQAVVGQ